MSYICKREDTENTKPMDFKKIAHAAVCRWNEKRHADKTADTLRAVLPETGNSVAPQDNTLSEATEAILQLPEAVPTVREVASLKAANLESALSGFLAERYEFRFNVLTEATEFRHLSDEGNGTFRPATERDLNAICLEVHRHGIDCWDRDVARMVHSADVRELLLSGKTFGDDRN